MTESLQFKEAPTVEESAALRWKEIESGPSPWLQLPAFRVEFPQFHPEPESGVRLLTPNDFREWFALDMGTLLEVETHKFAKALFCAGGSLSAPEVQKCGASLFCVVQLVERVHNGVIGACSDADLHKAFTAWLDGAMALIPNETAYQGTVEFVAGHFDVAAHFDACLFSVVEVFEGGLL